jgi:hypothetical protein
MSTQVQSKELIFNSKELNKILPSYLLNEIDGEQKELMQKSNNKQDILVLDNELKNVRQKYILNIYFLFFIYIGY